MTDKEEPIWPLPEALSGERGAATWTVGAPGYTPISAEEGQALRIVLGQNAPPPGSVVDVLAEDDPESEENSSKTILGGATDIDRHILIAPASSYNCPGCQNDHYRNYRNHELAHARWGPDTDGWLQSATSGPKDWQLVELSEEVRINTLLARQGLSPELGCSYTVSIAHLLNRDSQDPDLPAYYPRDYFDYIAPFAGTELGRQLLANAERNKVEMQAWLESNRKNVARLVEDRQNNLNGYLTRNDSASLSDPIHQANIASLKERVRQIETHYQNLTHAIQIYDDDWERIRAAYRHLEGRIANLPEVDEEWNPRGEFGAAWSMSLASSLEAMLPLPTSKRNMGQGMGGHGPGEQGPDKPCHQALKFAKAREVQNTNAATPTPGEGEGEEGDEDDQGKGKRENPWAGKIPPLVQDKRATVWGNAKVIEPKRTVKMKDTETYSYHRRPVEEGATIRYPHRWAVDRSVFGRRRKMVRKNPPKGSILIDISGSMNWNYELLVKLIETIPSGTVATYSGDGNEGHLTILAASGYRVDLSSYTLQSLGGNLIDGPALAWLSKQPQPRVWLSDGAAWGKSHSYTTSSRNDAAKIARKGKIVRYQSPKAALRFFRKEMGLPESDDLDV